MAQAQAANNHIRSSFQSPDEKKRLPRKRLQCTAPPWRSTNARRGMRSKLSPGINRTVSKLLHPTRAITADYYSIVCTLTCHTRDHNKADVWFLTTRATRCGFHSNRFVVSRRLMKGELWETTQEIKITNQTSLISQLFLLNEMESKLKLSDVFLRTKISILLWGFNRCLNNISFCAQISQYKLTYFSETQTEALILLRCFSWERTLNNFTFAFFKAS